MWKAVGKIARRGNEYVIWHNGEIFNVTIAGDPAPTGDGGYVNLGFLSLKGFSNYAIAELEKEVQEAIEEKSDD